MGSRKRRCKRSMQERGLLAPGKSRDPLTIAWRALVTRTFCGGTGLLECSEILSWIHSADTYLKGEKPCSPPMVQAGQEWCLLAEAEWEYAAQAEAAIAYQCRNSTCHQGGSLETPYVVANRRDHQLHGSTVFCLKSLTSFLGESTISATSEVCECARLSLIVSARVRILLIGPGQ